jgi:acyl-coenzyme A thioesterase PaaI-like protein
MTLEQLPVCGFGRYLSPLGGETHACGLSVVVLQHHLNMRQRLHGGMAMSLQQMAFTRTVAALRSEPGEAPRLLSMNCELLDTAVLGAKVTAFASVTRITRSLTFLTGGLRENKRQLMSASAVFSREEPAPDATCIAVPPDRFDGFTPFKPLDPFCADISGIHERCDADGRRVGAVVVEQAHLDAFGGAEADNGLLLWMADIFEGRAARTAVQHPCVTLNMNIVKIAPVHRGDLLEIQANVEGQSRSTVSVAGHFSAAGRTVMSARSVWKILGAR